MYKLNVPVMCTAAYKYKEETLRELKRCGAERVVIGLARELDFKFSSDEVISMLCELVPYFKKAGLEVAVWIGETLGHDRYSAPVVDYGYQNMRLLDGRVVGAFCPLDEKFTDDIAAWLEAVASSSPDMILLDDDFRMGDNFGCCCELHKTLIREDIGENIPENFLELVLCGGGNKYRSAYLKAQGTGLVRMAKKLRRRVDGIDPDIRIGACITPDRWDANGVGPVEMSEILAGKTKPFIRLFGAPYHTCITSLGAAIDKERTEFHRLKNLGIEVISEGDTYPRPRFACPAAHLECFDMILRADGASDGIMKYMIDYLSSPSYETGYVDAHCNNKELSARIDELFADGKCFGFTPFLPLEKLEHSYLDCAKGDGFRILGEQTFEYDSPYELLLSAQLPTTYEDVAPKIIFGESARLAGENELSCGAIIDIEAAMILSSRGIDVGLDKICEDSYVTNGFSDVPCEYIIESDELIRLDPISIPELVLKKGARALTRLVRGNVTRDFVYVYENSERHKFLVLPFSAKEAKKCIGYFKNYHRRKQLTDAYLWMCGKPLDAYIETRNPSLYMLGKKNDNELKIGIWNLFDDKCSGIRVKINVPFGQVEFINCKGHVDGEAAVIDSVLYPYEFCALKLLP
jgi:hypothetical protein